MSELGRNWPLRLLALVLALGLWIAVAARQGRLVVPTVAATLRVVPVVSGAPAPGYRVTAVHVEPNVVVVRGHRSTIGRRDTIETTPVDVAGRRTRVTRRVGLALPDSVSARDDDRVQVTIDIETASGTALGAEGLRR